MGSIIRAEEWFDDLMVDEIKKECGGQFVSNILRQIQIGHKGSTGTR